MKGKESIVRGSGCLLVLAVAALTVLAPTAWAGPACCAIVAIGGKTGVVVAKDNTTGKSFKFLVKDAALLRSLKVGQKVDADHKARKVSVDGVTQCCAIIEPIAKAVEPEYVTPCCSVAAVDVKTGVVQVRQRVTGRVIKVQLSDRSFLESLKVGQAVDLVNIAANRVKLHLAGPAAVEGVRLN